MNKPFPFFSLFQSKHLTFYRDRLSQPISKMKRQNSSASIDFLNSIPPPKENDTLNSKQIYSREFQAMLDSLDEEDFLEEASQYRSSQKKRRLRTDQVKALEKNFEADNKLEPGRKLKLGEELGLQPRQVAIWFQNRRARWKTKELEKDYALLKASFDALKSQYDDLQQKQEALTTELRVLKSKDEEEKSGSSESVKEEPVLMEVIDSDGNSNLVTLKEESDLLVNVQLLTSPEASSSSLQFNSSSSSSGSSVYSWVRSSDSGMGPSHWYDQARLVKVEEQSALFNAEESTCNFFSVDQAPTLQW